MLGLSRNAAAFRTMTSVMAVATMAVTAPALAQQVRNFDIPAQAANKGVPQFAKQAGIQILANGNTLRGKRTNAVQGAMPVDSALRTLLSGTGLVMRDGVDGTGIKTIVEAPRYNSFAPAPVAMMQAASESRVPAYDEIIVTAQKKEERITDVPIAMTALSAEALDDYKIEGGSELLRAIPNVNFSKSNFSMYNFSIRGVGTKAVSASSDPAVAVSFNNSPLIRNRLFEAEFFDMQRIEVLRGPQGTLYGRNATAGVVNLIPAMPEETFKGELKAETGNYQSRRLSGMLNIPISDTLSVRTAGAMTQRSGYDYNTYTQNRVNGRDLWSVRSTVSWTPSDHFSANFIWQHFEEDDNRARTGKQLCTRDAGPEYVGDVQITDPATRGKLSQGCLPGSIYADEAFGTPNGYSLVYLTTPMNISLGFEPHPTNPRGRGGPRVNILKNIDPFGNVGQSKNLRHISTEFDPIFRANNDIYQVNLKFETSNGIQINSQSMYSSDSYYSSQDYNRYMTEELFQNSTQPLKTATGADLDVVANPGPTPNGIYCDPQLGCSKRMLSLDISRSENRQYSQELRASSSFDGKLNFNIGANYLDFKSQDDYFVFNNMFTIIADWFYSKSFGTNSLLPCIYGVEERECPVVDRNSIANLTGDGHNYFVSQNGVSIKSLGLFGEMYYEPSYNLKITAGARYTRDKKVADQVPSQLLLGGGTEASYPGDITGGRVNSGYPELPEIRQKWEEFTGRFVIDWKPDFSFTDSSLIYLSASRGYKGGGVNPPRVDLNPDVVQYQYLPQTFRPEFVNGLELGVKNSVNGGRITLNATAFVYDYKDYQISQIVDRIAYNENFDAINWGIELEAAWSPTSRLRFDGNFGYLRTRLKDGSKSIDVMNRTQGNPEWMVLRPWLQVPSNCIAPKVFVEQILAKGGGELHLAALCPGSTRIGGYDPDVASKFYFGGDVGLNNYGFTYNPFREYNPSTVGLDIADGGSGAPNGGRGFDANLGGNELPNAPRWTLNVGAQYKIPIDQGAWELTLRGDYYAQAKSFARIYNTQFDRLKSWSNINAMVALNHVDSELYFQLYVKNLLNRTHITDFFLNSDDTGLTANIFTTDPRIIGFSASKKF